MVRSARVPAPMADLFDVAERQVERHFEQIERHPERGTVHVGGDRYIMVRAESFYLAFMDTLQESVGHEAAGKLLYAAARDIGKRDAAAFAERTCLVSELERLASGAVQFAHAGFAFVRILDSSDPRMRDRFYLHYEHPNTFETEVLRGRGVAIHRSACHFSAGYASGWCSLAFDVEVHVREVLCVARGDCHCEFIMARADDLDWREQQLRASWIRT